MASPKAELVLYVCYAGSGFFVATSCLVDSEGCMTLSEETLLVLAGLPLGMTWFTNGCLEEGTTSDPLGG